MAIMQAQSKLKKEVIGEARRLLKSTSYGVMSTISIDVEGYPFGSHMPYCLDSSGNLLIYISTLAQHTKNLDANPKCSLTIIEPNPNHIQNSARLTYIGNAKRVTDEEFEEAYQQYVRYFPNAKRYRETHDFHIYRVEPVRIRYIGGFGKIFWIETDELFQQDIFDTNVKEQILTHMNEDHVDFMKKYFVKHLDMELSEEDKPRMVDIDKYGVTVMLKDIPYFFEFEEPLADTAQAKDAIIKLAN